MNHAMENTKNQSVQVDELLQREDIHVTSNEVEVQHIICISVLPILHPHHPTLPFRKEPLFCLLASRIRFTFL